MLYERSWESMRAVVTCVCVCVQRREEKKLTHTAGVDYLCQVLARGRERLGLLTRAQRSDAAKELAFTRRR